MSVRGALETFGIGALAVGCCVGLPLLVAGGIGVAAAAWIGGALAALVAAGAVGAVLVNRLRTKGGPAERGGAGPLVEVLYFDGCPNHPATLALVERLSRELGLDPTVRAVNVADPEAAVRERFLGSPTVRVDGRDIEPGADERTDFVLSCRVYRTERGLAGQPVERWVRDALLRAAHSTLSGTGV